MLSYKNGLFFVLKYNVKITPHGLNEDHFWNVTLLRFNVSIFQYIQNTN